MRRRGRGESLRTCKEENAVRTRIPVPIVFDFSWVSYVPHISLVHKHAGECGASY